MDSDNEVILEPVEMLRVHDAVRAHLAREQAERDRFMAELASISDAAAARAEDLITEQRVDDAVQAQVDEHFDA